MSHDHDTPPPAELRGLPRSSYARSHALPSDYRVCILCHGPIERGHRGDECEACADWLAYWESLTPVEQDAEYAMMDDYVQQHAGDV